MNIAEKGNALAERLGSVQVASEIGLLEFLAIILALLAIILPLAGIVAFLNLRHHARTQAIQEAEKISAEVAERTANLRMEAELPKIVEAYSELARHGVDSDMADEIAKAQNEGDDPK